jgi:hypothetical protein
MKYLLIAMLLLVNCSDEFDMVKFTVSIAGSNRIAYIHADYQLIGIIVTTNSATNTIELKAVDGAELSARIHYDGLNITWKEETAKEGLKWEL